MKCKFWLLAITLSSLYAATRTDHVAEMLAAENACMVKYPTITPAVLNELKKVLDLPKFQESHPEINCFMFCFGLELKLVDEDGVLHLENLKDFTVSITAEQMSHDDAQAAVKQCSEAAVHEDKCEKSGQYAICKMEQLREFELKLSKHDL